MADQLTLHGTIGTDPDLQVVGENLKRITFRLATSERRRDANGGWEDAHTNWYSVTAFGRLAANVGQSLRKGHRVLVQGKLRLSQFSRQDGSTGTRVEIVASHLGPDLVSCQATVARNVDAPEAQEAPAAASAAVPDVPDEQLPYAAAETEHELVGAPA